MIRINLIFLKEHKLTLNGQQLLYYNGWRNREPFLATQPYGQTKTVFRYSWYWQNFPSTNFRPFFKNNSHRKLSGGYQYKIQNPCTRTTSPNQGRTGFAGTFASKHRCMYCLCFV